MRFDRIFLRIVGAMLSAALASQAVHAQAGPPPKIEPAKWTFAANSGSTKGSPDAACQAMYVQYGSWGTYKAPIMQDWATYNCDWDDGGPRPTAVYLTCYYGAAALIPPGICLGETRIEPDCDECNKSGNQSGPPPTTRGDPASVQSGAQLESARDYESADGLLTVDRQYRSRQRGLPLLASIAPVGFGPNWQGVVPGRLALGGPHNDHAEYYPPSGSVAQFAVSNWSDQNDFTFVQDGNGRLVLSVIAGTAGGRDAFVTGAAGSVPDLKLAFPNGDYILYQRWGTYSTFRVAYPVQKVLANGYTQYFDYNGTIKNGTEVPYRVRDSFGRTLTLTWSDTDFGAGIQVQGGAVITAIGLPDGTSLAYSYQRATLGTVPGRNDQLTMVQRLSATSTVLWARSYLYEDARDPYLLTGSKDQNNARLQTIAYNDANQVTSSSLAGGVEQHSFVHQYDPGNARYYRTITNPLGHQEKFTINTGVRTTVPFPILSIEGLPSASVPADTITYGYEGSPYDKVFVNSITDKRGFQTTFVNDTVLGRPTSTTEAAGTADARTTTTTWHPTFDLPASEARPGLTVSYIYSPEGRMLTRTETDTTTTTVPYSTQGQARTWTYTWTGTGKVASVNGPKPVTAGKDDTLTFGYDAATGNLLTSTNGLNQVTTFAAYDANGRPGTMTDPNAIVTAFTYDGLGRTTAINVKHPTTAASDAITTIEYDIEGRVIGITRPGTDKLIVDYNLAGQVTSVRAASGERIDYVNNAMGGVTSETVKRADTTTARQITRTFDELNRMLTETLGPSRTTTWAYDKNGNATQMTSARSAATTFAFDGLNRLVSSVAPDTGTTADSYDPRDNPTAHTDAVAVQTTYVRNGFGEVIREVSPDRGTSTYYYNEAGELTAAIDGRGQRVDYTRDILGRVLTKTPVGQPASQIVTYSYDANGLGSYQKGRLTKVVDGSGSTLFQYDHRGNMLVKRQAIGTTTAADLSYAYDLADRITQITYPSGRIVGYVRDTKGRVTTVRTKANSGVSAWTNIATSMGYEAFGSLKTATLGNTLSMAVDWGNDGRLASRRLYVTSGGANRSLLTYAYDNDDNITGITDGVDATQSVTYVHDTQNRLTRGVTNTGTYKRTDYILDKNGNRSSVERRVNAGDASAAQTDTYTRTSGTNRLASVTTPAGTRSITYDNRGNTASETRPASVSVTTSYDGYGRLTSYTRTGDATQANVYNGLDDRVQVTSGSTVRRYLYDRDGRLLGEYGASAAAANVTAEWIWLEPEAANDNPWGGDDGTGGYSPIAVAVGSAGTLNWVHTSHLGAPLLYTTSTGAITTAPAALLPGFPGQLRTFADLFYNRYRDYDPTTGRYVQADPIGLTGGENPFVYAEANPLRLIDPTGLQTYWEYYTGTPDSVRRDTIDAIAGASDAATFNLTYYAREAIGANRDVRQGSVVYQRGEYVGIALSLCFGGSGGWRAAGTKGIGKEFSHWIPKRSGGPRTKWNGNFVPIKTHALSDPYRYRFMPKTWKEANPLPSFVQQQAVRIPRVYVGAAAGAAGSASTR